MKTILTFTLLLFSLVITAQNDTTDNNITETERIIDKYGEKAIEAFNKGVEKVTPVAEEGFKIAVRLQIAKGITNLIPLLAFIIFLIVFLKHFKKSDFEDDNNKSNILTIAFGVLAGIALLPTAAMTGDAIEYLVAPEWFAIKDIIGLF